MENENKLEMKLTMRLRTYSAHAVVMYARGTDYSILEVGVCAYLYLRLWETLDTWIPLYVQMAHFLKEQDKQHEMIEFFL